jgi:hypothetical protein
VITIDEDQVGQGAFLDHAEGAGIGMTRTRQRQQFSVGRGGHGEDLRVDEFGNSVKGQLAARFLARRLGLSLFVSEPEG